MVGETYSTQKGGVLTVIGDNGLKSNRKKFLLTCSICSEDTELFPMPFQAAKYQLERGSVPCGCSKSPQLSQKQYEIKANRAAIAAGYEFKGFVEFKGKVSKCKLVCPIHSEWDSTCVTTLLKGVGCPECGTSRTVERTRLNEDVAIADCKAALYPQVSYIGFVSPWKGSLTKLILSCEEHGEYRSTTVQHCKAGTNCPKCEKERLRNLKDDNYHISRFTDTGVFPVGTIFKRDSKVGFWLVTCLICSNDKFTKAGLCTGTFRARGNDLIYGGVPCRCSIGNKYSKEQWEFMLKEHCEIIGVTYNGWTSSKWGGNYHFYYTCSIHGKHRAQAGLFFERKNCTSCTREAQKECYIQIIKSDIGFNDLKFGKGICSLRRLKNQNSTAKGVSLLSGAIYVFPSNLECSEAERQVKIRFKQFTGSVAREVLPDGYTETLPISFMQQVEEIYKEHGGTLKPVSLVKPKRHKSKII